MQDATVVEVKGIGKTYEGGVEALQDVSLAFPRAKLSSLLGPSGCGKTTLLKIIAGLIPHNTGEVWVKGKQVDGPGPERAFVFQDFALLPWADVLRNVAFGLELRGVPRAEREEIARQQIVEVGLKGFESKHPSQLSGGMRQRVGLARARGRRGYYSDGRAVLLRRRTDPAQVPRGPARFAAAPAQDRDLRDP